MTVAFKESITEDELLLDYTFNRLHLKQIGSSNEVRITKDQQFVDWRLKLFYLTCWLCPKFNLITITTNKILTRRYFRREDGRFTYSVFTEVFISNRFSLSSFKRQSYSRRLLRTFDEMRQTHHCSCSAIISL